MFAQKNQEEDTQPPSEIIREEARGGGTGEGCSVVKSIFGSCGRAGFNLHGASWPLGSHSVGNQGTFLFKVGARGQQGPGGFPSITFSIFGIVRYENSFSIQKNANTGCSGVHL